MAKQMSEWRDVVGYEGLYQVNELGQIKSLPRQTTSGGLMKLQINSHNGYQYVCLCKNNKAKQHRVHRIVTNAFWGVNDDLQVNHKNGIKSDNRLENLEYCTGSENMLHAYRTGLEKPVGRKCKCIDDGNIFETLTECAIFYGGTRAEQIIRVCQGKRKHFRGRRFEYV